MIQSYAKGKVSVPIEELNKGLGIPNDLDFCAVELSSRASEELIKKYSAKYNILKSSDAHCLETLCSFEFFLDLREKSIDALFDFLQNKSK